MSACDLFAIPIGVLALALVFAAYVGLIAAIGKVCDAIEWAWARTPDFIASVAGYLVTAALVCGGLFGVFGCGRAVLDLLGVCK